MTKRLDFGAVDRRTIVKAGAVAGLAQVAAPFVWSARAADAIKVGMVDPFTGVYAAVAQNEVIGVKLAVEQINAKGGVLGRPLELLVEDSANDVGTGVQELEGCLEAYLDPGAGDERVVAAEVGCLFSFGVIEVAATLAQGVVVAMHFRKGLLADVAGARLMELGAIVGEAVAGGMLGLRRLEPERRIFRGAALDAQARRREHFPVVFLRRFALGTAKCLCHPH